MCARIYLRKVLWYISHKVIYKSCQFYLKMVNEDKDGHILLESKSVVATLIVLLDRFQRRKSNVVLNRFILIK